MTKAIYGGTFDPITDGHVHVIQKASSLFDEITVVIAKNPNKNCMFSCDERLEMVEESLKYFKNVSVSLIQNEFLVSYAEDIGATHLIRGLRNVTDFSNEYDLYYTNKEISNSIETVFIMCDKDVQQVSSSMVKGLVGYAGWYNIVKTKVPVCVLKNILGVYIRKLLKEEFKLVAKDINFIINSYIDRPYHNLEHILKMLDACDEYDMSVSKSRTFKMAIIYHDIIMSDNANVINFDNSYYGTINNYTVEEKSALFYKLKRNQYFETDRENADDVYNLIMSTDRLFLNELSEDQKLMLSIDLLILSSKPDEYKRYVANVRKEYSDLSDDDWNRGRKEFVQSMLSKSVIYPHGELEACFGKRATYNLKEELRRL